MEGRRPQSAQKIGNYASAITQLIALGAWSMNPTESFSNHDSDGQSHSPLPEFDIHLMAIDDVLHQDDVELLKQQLAAAHHLLNYRQDVVHALTEQINFKEACLSHAQKQTRALKHQCDSQEIELSETQSICADLRELLKRQQRRIPTQHSHGPERDSRSIFSVHQPRHFQHKEISFGYESAGVSGHSLVPLTKAPPVEAWSAHETTLHEETMCCQRLTTLIVSSSSKVSNLSSHSVIDVTANLISRNSVTAHGRSVELPHFAIS